MTTAANGRKGPRHSFEEVVGISIHHDFVRAWCSSSLFLAGWGDRVRKQLGGFVRVVCRWMEIFRKQTLTPGLHNAAAAAAARSGSSSSSTAAVGGGSSSSSRGRNGRPTLRLPKTTKITSVPRGFGSASAFEWRAFCKCSASVGDGLRTRVPNAPQPMAPSRGATAASFTVDHRENFSRRRHAVSLVEAGPFREGFERLFGVTHFRKCGGRRRGRPVIALSSLNGKDGTGEGNVDLELEVFRFMQQSGRLDAFPTRQELVLAGRTDLAKAIDAEGGWLAAGWEEEVESISSNDSCGGGDFSTTADARGSAAAARGEEKDSSFHQKRFRRKSKTRSLKRNSSTAAGKSTRVRTDERSQGTLERRLNGTDVIQEGVNAVGDEDGRRKKGNRLTVLDIDGSEPFEDSSVLERAQRLPYKEKSAVVHRTKKPSRRVTSNDDLQDLEILSSLLSFAEELKVRKCCIKCKKAAPATWSLENMQWIKNMLKRPQRQDQWDGSLGQDSSAKNDFAKGVIETKTISGKTFRKNGFQMETVVEAFPAEKSLLDSRDAITDVAAALPTRKANSRKKEPAKVVEEKSTNDEVKGTSDWIQSIFDKRENWMLQARSKSGDNSFGASVLVDSKYMQNRIRKLAANLAETREALQSGREALWQTDEEVHQGAISELIDAEDTLEFRENAIKHARNELNTARAQVAALEVNLGVEMMEARKILEEKNHQTERARSFSTHLRTARIVWPNHANEVFLTGSFDGWNGQMKLEKSNAGVFVVSLPLYPGRYEIKFVVDGSWRVDTKRPIVYVGGFENNVLVVS